MTHRVWTVKELRREARYKRKQGRRAEAALDRGNRDRGREWGCKQVHRTPALPDLSGMVLTGEAARAKVAEWRDR